MKTAAIAFVLMTASLTLTAAEPPVAKKIPKTFTAHGEERVDDYGWLRDKKSAETIAYLEAENAYANEVMKPIEPLAKSLYEEMLGRIKQTDQQVPYRRRGYWYYTRTVEGKQYPILARKKGSLDAAEEILLDVNELAKGHKFMSLGGVSVSDDNTRLLYSTDNTGYRQYKLHVKDLRTGELLPDTAERVGSLFWSSDNKTIFYTTENDAKRQNKLFRHVLGSDAHTLVYEEKDELYDLYAERSLSTEWIFIVSDSKTTNEVRMLRTDRPADVPKVMVPRKADHKYYPSHRGDLFYIMTNDAGINYRIVTAPVSDPAQKNWKELVAYRKPVRIESVDTFKNHMVVRLREGGLHQFEIYDLREGGGMHRMSFPEPAYIAYNGANVEFDTNVFRYGYQSMVTPQSTYDYDMTSRKQTLLKRDEVLGGYDPADYKSERFFVTARDGAKVPVAIVYKKGIDPKGKNPLLLYSYGSYGSSTPNNFHSGRLSLLNRGVIYATAHIRGGGEMGKEWHEQGRMLSKMNTFTDFIDVADYLVKEGYTAKDKLAIQGGSAGGLLVGTVMNMRPDLFRVVLAYVPFVDVINTMSDATLPLTTQEYIEWGNPANKAEYAYMKSYDPYSNIAKKAYPAMLVRTSLNDSQVGYWEAAKWVAKLRAHKTDTNTILLRTNMGAGHGGASGRYDRLKDDAADYAWLLRELGVVASPAAKF
jgi:oligopeptidase B